MDNVYLKVSLAAPALVLDFSAFVFKKTFISDWEHNKGLMDGWYRSGTFSISAPLSGWCKLFTEMSKMDSAAYHDRIAILALSIYTQMRNYDPAISAINMPDFIGEDDPVLLKRGLFEIEMLNITNIEKSQTPFKIEM